MNKDAAETLAICAIAHIAGDEELLQGLIAQTGMGLDDLKAGIGSNEVQCGALEFLLSHEPFLMRFIEDSDYAPKIRRGRKSFCPAGRSGRIELV